MSCIVERETGATGRPAKLFAPGKNFAGIEEDLLRKRGPEVIDCGEFFEGDKFATFGLFGHSDFDEVLDLGYENVAPSDFATLGHSVTSNVLGLMEHGPGFLKGFSVGGLARRFFVFNTSAWDAPTAVANIAEEDVFFVPAKY